MKVFARGVAGLLFAFVMVASLAVPAKAHFDLEVNLRIIHVEHRDDGLRVYLRLPTPYAVAAATPDEPDRVNAGVSQFVSSDAEGGRTQHRLIPGAGTAAASVFVDIVVEGHQIVAGGTRLAPASVEARLWRSASAPAFSTLEEARLAWEVDHDPAEVEGALVGETQIDAVMFFPTDGSTLEYSFGSTLDPGLTGQEETANLLADHLPGTTRLYQATGTLAEPIKVSRSAFASLGTFVYQGIVHIVEGIDHVLFVLCLVLGASSLAGLLWRVTGFTLGHTVTLSLGFFGFVPSGEWFVPAVETGIALSIVYAAAVALRASGPQSGPEWRWLVITCGIGLLHGLGFSFVLHEILQVTSPNVWQNLLAFNIGVEIGQVMIVLVIWPLSRLLLANFARAWKYVRGAVLVGCILISLVWTQERVGDVMTAF